MKLTSHQNARDNFDPEPRRGADILVPWTSMPRTSMPWTSVANELKSLRQLVACASWRIGNREIDKMRIAASWILSAALAAVSVSCNQVSAATLTVHTQAPKVDVHLPPPKVNVSSPSPKVQTSSSHATVKDISVTKTFDKSSPKLYKYVSQGHHFNNGTITVRRSGGSNTAYDKKSNEKPTETMQLNYGHVEYK
jgi:Type VI secretion system effector, Hcp